MTNLGCNVKSCTNNEDKCCCLSSIQVDGAGACTCDNTCCSSYSEKNEYSSSNSAQSPKLNLSIACEADNCVYNSDKMCNADHIDISGICATDEDETVCATFKCR